MFDIWILVNQYVGTVCFSGETGKLRISPSSISRLNRSRENKVALSYKIFLPFFLVFVPKED